jgi:hypothetical protein
MHLPEGDDSTRVPLAKERAVMALDKRGQRGLIAALERLGEAFVSESIWDGQGGVPSCAVAQ